jgi:hypothetical protein
VTRHSEIKGNKGVGWRKEDGRQMFYDESVMERTGTQNMALRKSHLRIKGEIRGHRLKIKS